MTIFYYDLVLKFSSPITEERRNKIAAEDIYHAVYQYKKYFSIDIQDIEEIRQYEITKLTGRTRVEFTCVGRYNKTRLVTFRKLYKNKVRKYGNQ